MSRVRGAARWGARRLLGVFGRLPPVVRRNLIRLWAPSFMVGAASVIVHDHRVLLVRHTYRKGWAAPGGLLGRGEPPEATAVREVCEEVGLAIELIGGPVPLVWPELRRLDLVYLASLAPSSTPDDARARSVELLEARWFALDDLPDLDGSAVRALRALGLAPA